MRWPPDQYDWPLAAHSAQVLAAGHRWHVQTVGDGPAMVLLHGAGGAGQSWSYTAQILAQTHTVVVPDLVGQGFSQPGRPGRFGLQAMAQDVAALLNHMGIVPVALVGHSAGGAIALQMALNGLMCPVVCVNPALTGFQGVAGWLYPRMAKAMATVPFTATVFSNLAGNTDNVARLLKATGSAIHPEMARRYLTLVQDRDHVAGTLNMMAAWDLGPLLRDLNELQTPVTFLLSENDTTVPPEHASTVAYAHNGITVRRLANLGHLAHEEDPHNISQEILSCLTDA